LQRRGRSSAAANCGATLTGRHASANTSAQTRRQVHAEGEAEHAAIGHNAVLNLVPASAEATLRRAMADHDRDFAAFYNNVADMLEA
jgi:hypothetical protein